MSDGLAAQVGEIGGPEPTEERAEPRGLLLDQASDCLVHQHLRRGLPLPVHAQLDRPVRDRARRTGTVHSNRRARSAT